MIDDSKAEAPREDAYPTAKLGHNSFECIEPYVKATEIRESIC